MKWIGQHIYDQISRFRNSVYLEAVPTSTETDMLVVDSAGKVSKRAIDAITVDVSDFLTDGADNRVVTATGTDALLAETYLTFANSSNLSRMEFLSNEDTGDKFQITTTTHGATTLTTVDDDATAAHFEIAADGNITLDAAGDIALEAAGNVTVDTDNFTIESANYHMPAVNITSTYDGADGGWLNFNKTGGIGDSQGLGTISFKGENDAGTPENVSYASIQAYIGDETDGVETGQLWLRVKPQDGANPITGLKLDGETNANGEIDVTIAAGAASTTTIAGTLTMGSTAAMTNAGLLSVANQTGITGVGTISSGVWQGTAIASAYLDADTAHYSATKQFTHHVFKDDIDTTKHYIGLQEADAEMPSAPSKNLPFVAGVAGKLLKVFLRSSGDLSGKTLTWRLETVPTSSGTATAPTIVGTQSGAGCTDQTMTIYDFTTSLDSGDNVIDTGDQVLLSIQSSASTTNLIYYVTCLWEWDLG